jgi:hypothetical protein
MTHRPFLGLILYLSAQDKTDWPWRGGANGSVRFYPEINHAANAGMKFIPTSCKAEIDITTLFLASPVDLYKLEFWHTWSMHACLMLSITHVM